MHFMYKCIFRVYIYVCYAIIITKYILYIQQASKCKIELKILLGCQTIIIPPPSIPKTYIRHIIISLLWFGWFPIYTSLPFNAFKIII